jgi:ferredoxin
VTRWDDHDRATLAASNIDLLKRLPRRSAIALCDADDTWQVQDAISSCPTHTNLLLVASTGRYCSPRFPSNFDKEDEPTSGFKPLTLSHYELTVMGLA